MHLEDRIKNGMTFYEHGHTDPIDIEQEKELEAQRRHCKEVMFDYNNTRPSENVKKKEILKGILGHCTDRVFIESPVHMSYGNHVHLGDQFYANFNLVIIDDMDVYIGNQVMIGPNVTICTTGHPVYPLYREMGAHYSLPIHIGNKVWIGANSVVLPGVTIGENSVIGAGSIVTRDIPANVVAVGNPCRVLREITETDREYYFRDMKVDFPYTLRMREMITIKEIADQLGVSATTVSNVLNGRAGKMSQETRQRVEEALLRNHYVKEKKNNRGEPQHHLVAVYICLGKKKHVLTDPFCGSLLEGIDRELRKYNRAMVCGTVDDNESFAKVLQNSNLEGAILLGCEAEFCTALVHQIPIPIVFVDSYGEGFDNIGLEDYEGGYEMTSYLIGQGHRKIAFFGDQQHPMGSNLCRFRGLQDAMEEHKLEFDKDDYFYLPQHDNYRHEVLRQFAQNVKESGYTAAFFTSDLLANEAISIFYSQGISVPEDLSVTGFDDNIYARLSRPMLTTVRQKPEEKGKEAVGLLMRRIYGEEVPVGRMRLPTELIVRESVRNLADR